MARRPIRPSTHPDRTLACVGSSTSSGVDENRTSSEWAHISSTARSASVDGTCSRTSMQTIRSWRRTNVCQSRAFAPDIRQRPPRTLSRHMSKYRTRTRRSRRRGELRQGIPLRSQRQGRWLGRSGGVSDTAVPQETSNADRADTAARKSESKVMYHAGSEHPRYQFLTLRQASVMAQWIVAGAAVWTWVVRSVASGVNV